MRYASAVGFAGAVLLLAGSAGWAAPVPAPVPGPVPGPVTAERLAKHGYQNRLNAAAERILAAGGAGIANIVAAPENKDLRVYWPGEPPSAVRSVAKKLDVPVTFLPARYAHRELVAEAQRLAAGGQALEAAPKGDGSGVAVAVDAASEWSARSALQVGARVPLTITTGRRAEPAAGRSADTPPFWGGSFFDTATSRCTNGFAVQPPGSTATWMLSAGHCVTAGAALKVPGQPVPTGTAINKLECRDVALLSYGAGTAGLIYDGGIGSTSNKRIIDFANDFVGNLVDTEGASSGEHIDVRVQAVDVFIQITGVSGPGLPCATSGPLTRAGYTTATCAATTGDSGGPVVGVFDQNHRTAHGTISAASIGTAVCPGPSSNGGSTVWYAPLSRPSGDPQGGTLAAEGVVLKTVL